MRHPKTAITAVLCASALSAALAAAPASAGQIVWVRGGGSVWAANDDGTYPHELLAATSPALSIQLPGATLGNPDVFQAGGATVLFSAAATADPANAAACSAACVLSFSLTAGVLTRQSPASSALPPGAVFEQQPRLLAGGQMVDQYSVYPSGVVTTSAGSASQQGLYVRPLNAATPGTAGTAWSNTPAEALGSSADPAPDPANPALIAWVENQDPSCSQYTLNGSAVCQYAIVVGGASAATAPAVAIFDDEAPGGHGPSSLAWSSNGRTLLIVDDQPPNDGIYTVSASTSKTPASKAVTEVIAEPPGWTFVQARFAGSRIVFDARGAGHGTPGRSDIYSISASCNSGTCAFPLNATNLTHDAAADNIDPAWTSATSPLLAVGATPPQSGQASFDAAALRTPTVSPQKGVSFEVTLSAAATVVATISRDGHTIGATTLHLRAGATTFAIKQSGGHPLAAGRDTATLRVRGAGAGKRTYSASFTVS